MKQQSSPLVPAVVLLVLTAAADGTSCPQTLVTNPSWTATSAGNITLSVDDKTGCFSLSVREELWLASSHLLLSASKTVYRQPSLPGHHQLLSAGSRQFSGADALGSYKALSIDWLASNSTGGKEPEWTTTFRAYSDKFVFEQEYGTGVRDGQTGPPAAAGLTAGSGDSWGVPQSVFPSISATAGKGASLGALTFHNQGTPQSSVGLAGLSTATMGFAGGVPVVLVDNATDVTMVISPIDAFLSTTFSVASDPGDPAALLCGVQGAATAVPKGHRTQVMLMAGEGLTDTVMRWGSELLRLYGKSRTAPDANVHVERLGYSTVGHYFYGLARGMNAEQTMRAVADDAVSKSLPFSWWLLDSWWYGENSTPLPTTFGGSNDSVPGYGGTWRWDDTIARTRAGGFPSGLRNLTDYLGGPLVMHFGEWVGNSSTHPDCGNPPCNTGNSAPPPYSDPALGYPNPDSWVIGSGASLPLGPDGGAAFWDRIWRDAADWGLTTFKLDHAQSNIPNLPEAQTDLYASDTWLTTMTNVAAKHGISKQFGGCVSSMFLHSVTLPSVKSARVGPDYIPSASRAPGTCATPPADEGSTGELEVNRHAQVHSQSAEGSATLGRNSLVPWALGIRPYKDATFTGPQHWGSTTCLQRDGASYTMPEWWGLQDPYPELGVVVSAMAAGPIASCDGVLLKPNRPAVAIDAQWYGDIFRDGPLQSGTGEVSETFSTLRVSRTESHSIEPDSTERELLEELRWNFVLGWGIDNEARKDGGYNISAEDIGLRPSAGAIGVQPTHLAWPEYLDGHPDYSQLRPFPMGPDDSGLPIQKVKGAIYGEYVLWRTAPVMCDSWTGSTEGGFALLGESAKFISVSSQRIATLSFNCAHGETPQTAGVRVVATLVGAPQETVTMAYVPDTLSPAVKTVECQLGPNGKSALVITVDVDGKDHASCGPN